MLNLIIYFISLGLKNVGEWFLIYVVIILSWKKIYNNNKMILKWCDFDVIVIFDIGKNINL